MLGYQNIIRCFPSSTIYINYFVCKINKYFFYKPFCFYNKINVYALFVEFFNSNMVKQAKKVNYGETVQWSKKRGRKRKTKELEDL